MAAWQKVGGQGTASPYQRQNRHVLLSSGEGGAGASAKRPFDARAGQSPPHLSHVGLKILQNEDKAHHLTPF